MIEDVCDHCQQGFRRKVGDRSPVCPVCGAANARPDARTAADMGETAMRAPAAEAAVKRGRGRPRKVV